MLNWYVTFSKTAENVEFYSYIKKNACLELANVPLQYRWRANKQVIQVKNK